jgi:hypothetical protein
VATLCDDGSLWLYHGSWSSEDLAVSSIDVMLPEERRMIRDLLGVFPEGRETKVAKLLSGLHVVGAIGIVFDGYSGSEAHPSSGFF